MKLRSFRMIVIVGSALLVVSAMGGLVQPTDSPQDQPGTERTQASSPAAHDSDHKPDQRADRPHEPRRQVLDVRINAKALRARLNRSILRAEETLKLHRAALAKLDEGASASEVLAAMKRQDFTRPSRAEQRPAQRPGLGPGPGGLSPQERQAMYQFLREHFPKLADNLQQIVEYDARSADRLLARMSPQIREILLLTETQPELAQLKIAEMRAGLALVEASGAYRAAMSDPAASESDRADAIARVRQAAGERFDAQLKAKKLEVAKLEARLNELKDSVHQIEQRRDTEIEQMVESTKRNARRHLSKQGNKDAKRTAPESSGND